MANDDDDTTPDPMFKNVPRRPRSAASCPPPCKEEPDGGDPGGISVSNNASPPVPTSVASKKRPTSSTGGGAAEHVPRAKKHRMVPMEESKNHRHRLVPIKELEPEDAKDRVVGALDRHGGVLGGMPLELPLKDKAAAAAAAAAASSASSSEAEPAVDWAENERCRKGKTPAVNEDDKARTAVALRALAGSGLGNGKLLGDAIRSHRSTAVAGTFKAPSRTTKPEKPRTKPKKANKPRSKHKNKPMKKDSGPWFWCATGKDGVSSAGSDADYSFDRLAVVSDRLRTTLRGLGVAAPVRLYGRFLTKCDREDQQARLLMSHKKWRAKDAEFPLCAFLTEEENKAVHRAGMPLTAYDRGGDAYELTFRFLESNKGYRLIRKWVDFLKHNGLAVGKDEEVPVGDDVMIDLWMFRTPGGKAGMVMLHYRRGDAAHADAALDEVEQRRPKQPMLNNGAVAAADDAVMEDAVGDANEDAAVNGEVAAAAPAPSSPSEPSGGGGAIESAEAAGAPGQVAAASSPTEPVADAPSTSSELHGGAGRSDEVTAPLSLGGGDGTEEERAETGGALMVMVQLEVEVAKQSPMDSNAGGAPNEVAAPPSSPEGGAVMMATGDAAEASSDEDEAAAGAGARSWNVTEYEFRAAQTLMMMSRANSDS